MKLFAITRMCHDTCGNSWPHEKKQTMFVHAESEAAIRNILDRKLAFVTFSIDEIKIESSYLNALELLDDRVYNTFKRWKSLGYGVLKGSKSKQSNAQGEALFSNEQVTKLERRHQYPVYMDDWMDQEF